MKPFVHSAAPRNSIASVYFGNGIYKAPQMNHFFFSCLLFLDSFLYLSYVELVDTRGQGGFPRISHSEIFFYQAKANSVFCLQVRNEKFYVGKMLSEIQRAVPQKCAAVFGVGPPVRGWLDNIPEMKVPVAYGVAAEMKASPQCVQPCHELIVLSVV